MKQRSWIAILLLDPSGSAAGYSTASGMWRTTTPRGLSSRPPTSGAPLAFPFDQSDNLYVGDTVDGNIHRFQPGGGIASPATSLTPAPIPGEITGLKVPCATGLAVDPISGDLFVSQNLCGNTNGLAARANQQRGRVRLRTATIYINGFTIRIVARDARSRRIIVRRTYAACRTT